MSDRKHSSYRLSRLAARSKPKLGQNFLVSPTAPRAIVDALGDLSQATVVEIGPGTGVLTNLLAPRAKQFVAVELDHALASALERTWKGHSSVEIITQDILTVDLTRLATEYDARLLVVGNMPYYISSPILMHLFAHSAVIDRAVLMAQKEVADRVAAAPGSRDYGLLSATAQMYATVQKLFNLPPEAFDPPPEVYSAVMRLLMHSRFEELGVESGGFIRFLRQAFAQKRKTLGNNLRASEYSAEAVEKGFRESEVDPQARAEALPLDAMARLYRVISAQM
jgi:16S rRNA (adenine1518-N6/adenine1519-N6)-dimethyltransferase